jgi:hypothetical protein
MIHRVFFYRELEAFEQDGENGLSDVDFALLNVDFAPVDGHEFFIENLSAKSPDDGFQNFNVMLLDIFKFRVKLAFINLLKFINEGFKIDCLD